MEWRRREMAMSLASRLIRERTAKSDHSRDGSFDLRAFEPDDRFDENQAKSTYESSKNIIDELSLTI